MRLGRWVVASDGKETFVEGFGTKWFSYKVIAVAIVWSSFIWSY
jgi:hypothetical protein